MTLSFMYGVHVVATRETLWRLCGYGASPVDRYLNDLVNIILVYIIVIQSLKQINLTFIQL